MTRPCFEVSRKSEDLGQRYCCSVLCVLKLRMFTSLGNIPKKASSNYFQCPGLYRVVFDASEGECFQNQRNCWQSFCQKKFFLFKKNHSQKCWGNILSVVKGRSSFPTCQHYLVAPWRQTIHRLCIHPVVNQTRLFTNFNMLDIR